jgi:hypothetical protein
MTRKHLKPKSRELQEAILDRIRSMTREELIEAMAYRPEGAVETWRMQRLPEQEPCNGAEPVPDSLSPDVRVERRRATSRPRKTRA